MKKFLHILGLIGATVLMVMNIQALESGTTKITGEVISVELNTENAPPVDSTDGEAPPLEPADFSNATLTISYDHTNDDGEVEKSTLFEGPFKGKFADEIVLSQPTEVEISLQLSEDSSPMTISTVFGNGADVHFAYIDRPGPRDSFWLVGSTNQVMAQKHAFSVSGDLSFLDLSESDMTAVEVYAMYLDQDGNNQMKQWGPVLVKNNSFMIQGDVERPLTATMYIQGSQYLMSSLVIEPKSELVVGKLGDQTQELSITSGTGYHAAIVESWQQSEKYIALQQAYATEYDQYLKRRAAGEPEPEAAESDSDSDSEESEEIVPAVPPAEGCEDSVAQEQNIPDSSWTAPSYYTLQQKAVAYKNEILRKIVEDHPDPMARYLALDMRPYDYDDFDSQLAAFQTLSKLFDEDFVAAYITPRIESMEQALVVRKNDAKLIPGQRVPEFTLASYDGEDTALFDVLADKDMVLIDFWASWCGPCIADFPELKNLHAAYTDEDFEIVGVSIDSTTDDWIGGVDDHELPWLNLGEIKGWEGPVSTMYGVMGIPKGFLVDSEGCIYKKNIRPAALKEFLVDRYGMDESLIEPTEEVEETPEVSS